MKKQAKVNANKHTITRSPGTPATNVAEKKKAPTSDVSQNNVLKRN